MNHMTPLYRKIAAISLLLIAILLTFQVFIAPIGNTLIRRSNDIAALENKYERLQNIKARLEASLPSLQEEVIKGDGKQLLLDARTDALASAALQTRMRTLMTSTGVTLRSILSLPNQNETGSVVPIHLKLSAHGNLEDIQEALQGIEVAQPAIFIDALSLKPARAPQGGGIWLDMEMELSAYRVEPAS